MAEQIASKEVGQPVAGADDISLLDLLIVVAKYKKFILGSVFGVAVAAAGVSMILPNIYVATARLLPPAQSQSNTAALIGQLGSLAGVVGGPLAGKNPSDIYLGMLGSRTVGERLMRRFDLQNVYETKLRSDTLKALAGASVFTARKDGLIEIQVEDKDAKRAAALANGYVDELQRLTLSVAVTEASQRRLFFEKQMQQAKQNLADAEVALKKVQQQTGLIRVEGQADVIIGVAANLKAQIAAKEVQLGAMRTFATADNPDYIRLQQELVGLRAQLAKAETGMSRGNGDIAIATSKVPDAQLEYVRKVRDVRYNEAILEVLTKQYEVAKIDEAKDSSIIQVLDAAVEPDRKSKPKRAVMVMLAALVAGVLATCYVFIKEWLDGVKKSTNSREYARLMTLRSYLRTKR